MTTNEHESLLSPTYNVPSRRNGPQLCARYIKMNEMTFSALNYGTADSIICHKVNKYRATKDGMEAYLEIGTYQKDQGSKEICAANLWAELN